MDPAAQVRAFVEPLLQGAGVELFDVEVVGGVVRVVVDRIGGPTDGAPRSVDLDTLSTLTRQVSQALDDHDPLPGRYTLEVTSPGLERPLRRPEHFARSIGERVSVKTIAGVEGDRRVSGVLSEADDEGVVLALDDGARRRLSYADIERARTVFDWGPAPHSGTPSARTRKKAATS